MDFTLLEKLGLSRGPVEVYRAMLEQGAGTIEEIQRATGFERRNIYDMLAKLQSRGAVTYSFKGKQKIFRATSPKRVLEHLDGEIQSLQDLRHTAEFSVREWEQALARHRPSSTAEVYEGKNALRTLFVETLETPDCYCIGGNNGITRYLGQPFWQRFNAARKKRKVTWHELIQAGTDFPEYQGKTEKQLLAKERYEARVLPPVICNPTIMFVYPPKVAHIIWSEHPVAFVMHSDTLAQNFIEYFRLLWDIATPPRQFYAQHKGTLAAQNPFEANR